MSEYVQKRPKGCFHDSVLFLKSSCCQFKSDRFCKRRNSQTLSRLDGRKVSKVFYWLDFSSSNYWWRASPYWPTFSLNGVVVSSLSPSPFSQRNQPIENLRHLLLCNPSEDSPLRSEISLLLQVISYLGTSLSDGCASFVDSVNISPFLNMLHLSHFRHLQKHVKVNAFLMSVAKPTVLTNPLL